MVFLQIGVMVMTHGDDKGLVLPPRVAPIQVIVIPDPLEDVDTTDIRGACETIVFTLNQAGIRADLDAREKHAPEWKYSHWEMKGVPLRIEIDVKDLAKKQVPGVFSIQFSYRVYKDLLLIFLRLTCHHVMNIHSAG